MKSLRVVRPSYPYNYLSLWAMKELMYRIWIGLLLLCFTVGGAWSQQRIKVYGYVIDREDKPIELASVKVAGKAIGTATNLKGAYSLALSPTTDSIALEFSCIGYRSVTKSFPKGITQDLRLNVTLPDASTELSTVVVAAPSKKQQNMSTIAAENIRVAVGPSTGVESLVGTYAGVTQNNELSAQYSVRGGNYDENMVYVNGIEIPRPLLVRTAQQEGLSFVHPEMTQSVNFSAGGYTAEYGDKMSSVLDIRYKTPKEFEGSVEVGLQGDQVYIGSRGKKLSQITGLRFKDGRTLLGSLDTKGEYEPLYFDAQSYIVGRLNDRWSLSFLGNVSLTHYQFKPQTRETSFGTLSDIKKLKVYFEGQERDRFVSLFGAFSATYTPSSEQRHVVSVHFYNSREMETYDIEGSYFLDNAKEGDSKQPNVSDNLSALATGTNMEHARNRLRYTLATLSYSNLLQLKQGHLLKGGLSARLEDVNDFISEWTRRDSAGYNVPHHSDRIEMLHNLYSQNHLRSYRLSAYLVDQFSLELPQGELSLYPGIRASYWGFNKEFIASPRFVAAFTPTRQKALTLRFATGLYYQAPFYKEIRTTERDQENNNIVVLNKQIRSQGSLHVLLGGDYNFQLDGRNFRFTTELYYKYLYHLNPYRVDNVKVRYLGTNTGSGYVAGIDLKLFGQFVPDVDSWLTASLLTSKQRIPGIGEMPLPNAPSYNVSLFFQDYFPGYKRIRLSLRGVLSGGLPQFRPTEEFLPPAFIGSSYKRVDLGLIYRFFDRSTDTARAKSSFWKLFSAVDLSLECFNLLDNTNVSGFYWVTDAFHQQFAVPNYLTRRQLNARLRIDF